MPSFIQQLETAIEAKKEELARMEAELEEMVTAARVYRRMQGGEESNGKSEAAPQATKAGRVTQTGDGNQAPRKPAREWALEILKPGISMHYKEVAKEAIRRGYTSIQSSDAGAPIRTFMSTLYRLTTLFESKGKGYFMLKEQGAAKEE